MAVQPVLLLLLLCMSRQIAAMQMKIGFGERKCFTDDLNAQRPVLIDFRASAGQSDMEVDLFVTDNNGKVVFHKSGLSHHRATIDPRNLHASQSGHTANYKTFRFCVMHQIMPGQVAEDVERRIVFSIRSGPTQEEKHGIAKFHDTDRTNTHIRKLEQEILVIVDKMDGIREQERILTLKNEGTTRFVTAVSSLTSLLVIGVGMLQLELVHGVLKERKMIH